jgi:HSP90 family molecular chaperone
VHLLSDQLYQSPLKALEELVINSYDAGAKVCRLFVPSPSEQTGSGSRKYISVFDTGSGLTDEGMVDLWHIGRSNKRTVEIEKRSARKLIGKFGIGKLATYTVASKLTYVSKTAAGITSATLNFDELTGDASGGAEPDKRIDSLVSDFDKAPNVGGIIAD